MIAQFLSWLGSTRLSAAIAESAAIFPWLEVVHVAAIGAVLGTIAIVDLRLIGLAAPDYPAGRLTRALLPATWCAFALAALTGALMFTSQPELYWDNWYFRAKMALLLLAGLNMAAFHLMTGRGMAQWETTERTPVGARAAGAVSILLWILIVAAGRWIGFTMAPF